MSTGITEPALALFPGRFGREKWPGNFREFKLYTDVTSWKLYSSSEVHVIPAENGPFLLVEATVYGLGTRLNLPRPLYTLTVFYFRCCSLTNFQAHNTTVLQTKAESAGRMGGTLLGFSASIYRPMIFSATPLPYL